MARMTCWARTSASVSDLLSSIQEKAALLGAAFLFLLAGCASSPESFGGSRAKVVDWAAARGLQSRSVEARGFSLLLVERGGERKDRLTVYIEGDGAAWPTRYQPPRDPTPVKPLSLALAAAAVEAFVYLGRPCQYLLDDRLDTCSTAWWTRDRYGADVIAAYSDLLDQLRLEREVREFRLVGHSGGGVIAALLASRRADIGSLVTVAAPLDVGAWVAWHRISPLAGSLDPGLDARPLPLATHWAGGKDDVVPPAVVRSFVERRGGRIQVVEGYDHECCWVRDWARLIEESP